uniref:Uncharacterized protein n=1 Tax=Glossina pallidipes TaxID=7398 RepID=A0A1A9ZIP4_GLOPL
MLVALETLGITSCEIDINALQNRKQVSNNFVLVVVYKLRLTCEQWVVVAEGRSKRSSHPLLCKYRHHDNRLPIMDYVLHHHDHHRHYYHGMNCNTFMFNVENL